MTDTKSILFVGVGGQGTILASKILTDGLIKFGYDVKMSEVHGMAQRGGSVTTQVRFGSKVFSPIIEKGTADAIVAFEKIEAVRSLEYLKKDGSLIVNDYEIYPSTVLVGREKYPDNINEFLKTEVENTLIINAVEIAEDIGNIKAQNMVLLGVLIKVIGLEDKCWDEIIDEDIPQKLSELNKSALYKGITI